MTDHDILLALRDINNDASHGIGFDEFLKASARLSIPVLTPVVLLLTVDDGHVKKGHECLR